MMTVDWHQPSRSCFDSARRECLSILPELFPWDLILPWAPITLRESPVRRPEGADHARGFACAKGASGSITRGAGTSATVSSQSAGGRSAAGRRPDGRPGVAGMPRSEPSTPRQRRSVVNESNLYPSPLKTPKLRRRVVTQLNLFFPSFMRSARMSRTTRNLGPQPGTLLLLRLPSGRSERPRP